MQAQSNLEKQKQNSHSNVNEVKVESELSFDVNQKFRKDISVEENSDPNKKTVRFDPVSRVPMQKVAGQCGPKVERREE
mgnify:FL=1